MQPLTWRKSTYSPDGSNCVEIATTATVTLVRDSKTPTGSRIAFPRTAWADFLSGMARAGAESRP
ncbi:MULTISPECIES: DUF397 domain-containing protein [unclassified Streptomyces]|uniref:DUF397 domain-containing protein n=1 Tax=unclassified Streptomyces TaxID=2593676 RepID=UPI002442A808|nr:DUF397 domain-containing protein [Streptomyces sp. DH41]MDG9724855.1 DUF397 domain-containing protein [Streptomyces sp. DH41]